MSRYLLSEIIMYTVDSENYVPEILPFRPFFPYAIFNVGDAASCDSLPCVHPNATCINTQNISEILCICPSNWTGQTCDVGKNVILKYS